MSTTIDNATSAKATMPSTTTTKRSTVPRQAPEAVPASTNQTNELLVKRPTSEITRLVFMGLLGCAACIALVGVVGEANGSDGTSPDDPPPAVIIN